MDVRIKKTVAPNIDSLITPETNIIFRCIDCQSFLLPDMIHVATFRFRDKSTGEGKSFPIQICPVCYDSIGAPEYHKDLKERDIPQSNLITLTRHQYEQTKQAEGWGLTYDLKTDTIRSNLLVN